ncbi:PREDICTED: uncharacterized protein LOC108768970 [Trachymyrmex cornetzi]|uniref:uncharacterized protein LOC108768970 n=1 Tax=Trachymyrmex cornetzi TaxID=471704 RepID=UPI00084F151B|nr:PREDICTED: uncharacterized protein LOC108768970 [Trachymyrmex cornetzi]XP_018375205.1 PREDICTED: uncharacterized protein LOC108768970 [Trachymyrmex cornetzi]
MRTFWIIVFCVITVIAAVYAKPTIYKKNQDNVFEPVMVPVSSTVIPLPVYKVGYGLGFVSKDKKTQLSSFKPEGGIKLITISKVQEKKI